MCMRACESVSVHTCVCMYQVDKRTMHKNEKESKEIGKASFAFAWLLDGCVRRSERRSAA